MLLTIIVKKVWLYMYIFMIEIQTKLHFKKYNAMDSDYFLFLIDLILKMNRIKSRNFEIFSNRK